MDGKKVQMNVMKLNDFMHKWVRYTELEQDGHTLTLSAPCSASSAQFAVKLDVADVHLVEDDEPVSPHEKRTPRKNNVSSARKLSGQKRPFQIVLTGTSAGREVTWTLAFENKAELEKAKCLATAAFKAGVAAAAFHRSGEPRSP